MSVKQAALENLSLLSKSLQASRMGIKVGKTSLTPKYPKAAHERNFDGQLNKYFSDTLLQLRTEDSLTIAKTYAEQKASVCVYVQIKSNSPSLWLSKSNLYYALSPLGRLSGNKVYMAKNISVMFDVEGLPYIKPFTVSVVVSAANPVDWGTVFNAASGYQVFLISEDVTEKDGIYTFIQNPENSGLVATTVFCGDIASAGKKFGPSVGSMGIPIKKIFGVPTHGRSRKMVKLGRVKSQGMEYFKELITLEKEIYNLREKDYPNRENLLKLFTDDKYVQGGVPICNQIRKGDVIVSPKFLAVACASPLAKRILNNCISLMMVCGFWHDKRIKEPGYVNLFGIVSNEDEGIKGVIDEELNDTMLERRIQIIERILACLKTCISLIVDVEIRKIFEKTFSLVSSLSTEQKTSLKKIRSEFSAQWYHASVLFTDLYNEEEVFDVEARFIG